MKLKDINSRKITILTILIFLLATAVTPVLQNRPLDSASASYAAPLLHQYTVYQWANTFTAQQYASYTDAFQISYDASSSILNQIHAIEPSFTGLVYRNVIKISDHASSEWTVFSANNWILKDQAGNLPYEVRFGYYFADIGNPDYHQWVANWIYTQINNKNANGLFADCGLCTYPEEVWEFASAQPINPRTGTYWTEQQVRDAYVGLYNTIRAKLGSSKLIVVNGIWSGSRWLSRMSAYMNMLSRMSINGIMGEGWWRDFLPSSAWYTESRWKSSLDALVSIENNFIKGSSSKMFIPGCFIEDGDASLLPGVTATQVTRYGYASTLLGVQSNRNYLFLTMDENRLKDYANRYFSLNVGTPLSSYSLVSGTHVYQRQFSNAMVLVNPTSTPYTISLSGQYKNLNGATVTAAYTVPAHTGEILMAITQNQYSLSVTTVGSGSVTKNPDKASYDPGTVVTLTANPASGWTFNGWSGDLSGSANPISITINSNKAVTATFTTSTQYQLTVLHTGGKGWTDPLPGTYTYGPGSSVSVAAYDNEGWEFAYWMLDDVNVGASNPIAVTMNSNHVVKPMYTSVSPTPTVAPTPTPSPTPVPSPTVEPTPTPSPTPVPSPTVEPTPTPTPSQSPSPTLKPTPEPTITPTPTPVPSSTVEPTPTPTSTPSPSQSPSQSSTLTSTPEPTLMPTPTPPKTSENSSSKISITGSIEIGS